MSSSNTHRVISTPETVFDFEYFKCQSNFFSQQSQQVNTQTRTTSLLIRRTVSPTNIDEVKVKVRLFFRPPGHITRSERYVVLPIARVAEGNDRAGFSLCWTKVGVRVRLAVLDVRLLGQCENFHVVLGRSA